MSLKRENIRAYASSAAFFFFLSFVPFLLVICSIIPYTPVSQDNIIQFIEIIFPSAIDEDIVSFVDYIYYSSSEILPVAVILALWSAGQGVYGLQTGLNVINKVSEEKNYLLLRLRACLYTLVTLGTMLITFLMSLMGRRFLSVIYIHAPKAGPFFKKIIGYRYLFNWVVLAIAFTFIFALLPDKKLKLRFEIPGAIFAAITWVLFSWLFSIYVDRFNGLSSYGKLSSIILVLIWLYASFYILFVGAKLNKYFQPVIKVLFKREK